MGQPKIILMRNTRMQGSANRLAGVSLAAALSGLLAGPMPASAQSYPTHNITAIIPFAPGNANDITARIVLEQVGKQLGQAIIIAHRRGGGGTIGGWQAGTRAP